MSDELILNRMETTSLLLRVQEGIFFPSDTIKPFSSSNITRLSIFASYKGPFSIPPSLISGDSHSPDNFMAFWPTVWSLEILPRLFPQLPLVFQIYAQPWGNQLGCLRGNITAQEYPEMREKTRDGVRKAIPSPGVYPPPIHTNATLLWKLSQAWSLVVLEFLLSSDAYRFTPGHSHWCWRTLSPGLGSGKILVSLAISPVPPKVFMVTHAPVSLDNAGVQETVNHEGQIHQNNDFGRGTRHLLLAKHNSHQKEPSTSSVHLL